MAESQHLIHATDMLLSLAAKLPDNLMLDAKDTKGTFTFAFLQRLSDEQLAKLKKEASLHRNEAVCINFYTRCKGKHQPIVELKDFENFNFNKVLKIRITGKAGPFNCIFVTFVVV